MFWLWRSSGCRKKLFPKQSHWSRLQRSLCRKGGRGYSWAAIGKLRAPPGPAPLERRSVPGPMQAPTWTQSCNGALQFEPEILHICKRQSWLWTLYSGQSQSRFHKRLLFWLQLCMAYPGSSQKHQWTFFSFPIPATVLMLERASLEIWRRKKNNKKVKSPCLSQVILLRNWFNNAVVCLEFNSSFRVWHFLYFQHTRVFIT